MINKLKSAKAFIHAFDRRLNSVEWLAQKFHTEQKTIAEIAGVIGCSPETVQKRLRKHNLLGRDKILTTYTGRFHSSKHLIMKLLTKRYLPTIKKSIDDVYPKITSRNPLILKDILDEMAVLDQDGGSSSGRAIGMSRKDVYVLCGRFGICLYDYDSQYEERIDWLIREIIRRQDDFFFDECSNPENWFPNRKHDMWTKHFFAKRTKVGEPIFFIRANEATITCQTQTDQWFSSIKKER